MRLRGLSDEIIFDEFEEYPVITLHVFISSMLNMEMLFIPEYFPVKIYTSKIIYKQMCTYWNHTKPNCLRLHQFVVLKPNEPIKVKLDLGDIVEVCMFESDDINRNLMFMLRSGSKTHVYSGVVREFRSLIYNDVFKKWIMNGVDDLYVDFSRAMYQDERNHRELDAAVDAVETLISSNPEHTLIINLPKFGYETLIYSLAERMRACVNIGGMMVAVFSILKKMEYFVAGTKSAKILIVNKCFTLDEMEYSAKKHKYIFIKLSDKHRVSENETCQKQSAFRELNYSPLPSDFDLELLGNTLKPKRIYSIYHERYAAQLPQPIPNYLLRLCKDYAQIVEERKLAEKLELEDSLSTKSSCLIASEPSSTKSVMKLTQEDSATMVPERQKRVREWLFTENNSIIASERETPRLEKEKFSLDAVTTKPIATPKSENKIKTKKCSSISKFLEQAKQNSLESTPKTSKTYKNSFCVPKRSIQYLENSDSEGS